MSEQCHDAVLILQCQIRIKILLSFSTVYNSGTLRAAYVAELDVFFLTSFSGVVWTDIEKCEYFDNCGESIACGAKLMFSPNHWTNSLVRLASNPAK
jgi:hypothetical protein